MNRIVIAAGAVCLHMMLPAAAWAQPKLPYGPSDRELLMLPEPCRAIFRGGQNTEAFKQWLPGLTGHTHYCAGLNFMNRARFTANKTEKRFNLQSAVGEFGYVLKHSAPEAPELQHVREQRHLAETMLKLL